MLKDGGMAEAYGVFNSLKSQLHFDKGLLQDIGYKELYPAYQIGKDQIVFEYLNKSETHGLNEEE